MNRNKRFRPCSIPAFRPATFVRRAASLTCAGAIFCAGIAALADDANRIQPFPKNPFYWQNTAEESRLPVAIDYGAAEKPTAHKFFHTVPALENNEVVLRYQRAFVDKLLSYALKYD